MTLQMKLIAALASVLILVGSHGLAYYKGTQHTETSMKLDAATSEIKGREKQDEIAKDVKRLSPDERKSARAHWMRD